MKVQLACHAALWPCLPGNGDGSVALLRRWSSRWRRSIAAELLREFRRHGSHFAKFTEDLAQEPDARRERIAVGFYRIDQQVEQREDLLVGQLVFVGLWHRLGMPERE